MKIVVWLVGLLCVVGALLAGAFLGYRAVSQPNYAAKVVLGGLSAPVSIHRDRNAVPHIVAQSADDALSGLGYAQAQDRLWQFEMNRRLVNGQLAEILGDSALDTDKFLRTVGFRRNAARIWDLQDAGTRSAVLAYVAGINAAIADVQGKPWRQSPEFFLTNAEPIPWTPEDVIGWSSLMAWDLSGNMNNELLRAALWSRLGRARLQQLLSTDPDVNLPDFSEVYGDRVALSSVFELLYVHLVKLFPGVGQEGVGSNNWVVSGARSASGKPILANDPHLSMPSPALWHLAHLSWPGHELVGGGMPGLPFILSGRTKNFAWGLTNFNSDSQDVVLEELVPSSSNLYVAPKGVSAMKVVREEILVKDGPAVTLEIRETRNGPIISDVLPVARQSLLALGARAGNLEKSFALALRWTQLQVDERTMKAAIEVNRSSSFEDFEAALQNFDSSQQVFVYADTGGKIALIAPGRVPQRGDKNLMKGLAPIPGWLGDYDWQGFYPNGQASAFPRLIDPAEGWLASANQKPMGLSDSTFTGAEFTRPYRFDRIVDLIKASPRHDLKTFAAMQGDQRSLIMAKLVQALLRNLAGADPTNLTPELLKLQAWAEEGLAPSPAFPQGAGAAMGANLEEPLLATLWVDAFRRELLIDEIGDALFAAFEAQRLKTDIVLQALTLPAYAHWCDKIGTQARENCSDLVSSSLKLARAEMARRVKTLGGTSSWGAHHAMLFEHRPLGKHAQLGSWFNVHEPVGGDATTVFATRHEPWHAKDPVASQFGPGFRSRYDLADLEQSEYVIAPGQVGHVLSPYYEHLTKAWVEVRGVQIATEPAKFQKDSIGLTTLNRTPQ